MQFKLNTKVVSGVASAIAGAIAAGVIVSACGSGAPQLDDLQNVNPSYPNWAAIYLSPDNFPNVVEECINGAGFALTTRDNSAAAAQLVPQWSTFCASQEGKEAT